MANMITGLITITVSAVILSSVYIQTLKTTNTSGGNVTGWSASEIAMWGLLSLVAIVGLLYGVLNVFGLA